jgi:hypothetical protein
MEKQSQRQDESNHLAFVRFFCFLCCFSSVLIVAFSLSRLLRLAPTLIPRPDMSEPPVTAGRGHASPARSWPMSLVEESSEKTTVPFEGVGSSFTKLCSDVSKGACFCSPTRTLLRAIDCCQMQPTALPRGPLSIRENARPCPKDSMVKHRNPGEVEPPQGTDHQCCPSPCWRKKKKKVGGRIIKTWQNRLDSTLI